MADETKYTVISLFSGAGGLDIGLHQTDRFRTLAAVDFEKKCCETLRANKGLLDNCEVIQADLSELDPHELLKKLKLEPGQVDCVVGGPPCQPYSRMGKRLGLDELKGELIYHYLRFVEVICPKMFLFENVKGFLDFNIETKDGPVPLVEHYVRKCMKSGKYDVQGWLLDAADYGAPQSRERVLLIGNRIGAAVETPNASFGPPTVAATGHCKPWHTLRDAIGGLKSQPDEIVQYGDNYRRVFQEIPEGGNWQNLPVGHPGLVAKSQFQGPVANLWRRLKWDSPCPTVITKICNRFPGYCHPSQVRPLSVREVARVQGFPDEWVFCGGNAAKYMQIGNAVPIPLATVAGHVIADALDRAGKGKPKRQKWKGVFRIEWTKAGLLRHTLVGLTVPGGGDPLSEPEKIELKSLERQVRQHLTGYMKCGQALQRINDKRLYRETHATFEAYCSEVFTLDRSRAYQLMRAVETTENVDKLSTDEERPISEGQVRPLCLLKNPKDQAKAWDEAVKESRMAGSRRVTGAIAEQVVNEMLGKGKKPAEKERIFFSLMGNAIELKAAQQVPHASVVSTFTVSCADLEEVLKKTDKLMEDKVIDEGERSYILNEVRASAEKVLSILQRLPPPKEAPMTDDD